MVEASDAVTARQTAIVEAATGVFLRYGFKKTSMDDLARAANLSRQGLYLHFSTKEALFKAVVEHVVATTRAKAREALSRGDVGVEERIVAAFEAMHGHAVGSEGAENFDELLETTAQLVGPVVNELEQGFVADVARVLRAEGVGAAWKDAGISAKDLAEHLSAASYGLKHRVRTYAEYRDRMRHAVRIVCRGVPR
jgi:AcrR family transcriptional regulator